MNKKNLKCLFFLVISSITSIGQGVFINEKESKTILVPLNSIQAQNQGNGFDGEISFNRQSNGIDILPTYYGNNAASWMGKKILTDDVRKRHLKNVGVTYMRFPGGNLSNNYFWDGVIPAITKQDNNYSPISGTDNAWRLGLDEFLTLCDTLQNQAVMCVNASYARYGNSATPISDAAHYAAEFVRYVNVTKGKNVKFWEIGNENYGSWQAGYLVNGDTIDGSKYADIVRVFVDSMKAADPTIKIGAVAVEEDGEKGGGHNWWNKKMMPGCIDKVDFWITHQYFVYDKNDWNNITVNQILAATHLVKETIDNVYNCVSSYTAYPADFLPVAMTEYNLRGGTKEVSQVAALFIAECIGEYIKNKYGMVMLWDMQNGTKSSSSDGPGGDHGFYSWNDPVLPNGTPRPSFFVYYFAQKTLGNFSTTSSVVGDSLIAYSSVDDNGNNGIVIINQSNSTKSVTLKNDKNDAGNYYWNILHAPNKTDKKFFINGQTNSSYSEGGPEKYETILPFSHEGVNETILQLPENSVAFVKYIASNVTHQLKTPSSLHPYPNPSNGVFKWTKLCSYKVYDVHGKLITSGKNTFTDISRFSSGEYQLLLDNKYHFTLLKN